MFYDAAKLAHLADSDLHSASSCDAFVARSRLTHGWVMAVMFQSRRLRHSLSCWSSLLFHRSVTGVRYWLN